ncbi:Na+/H+ antiporter subunit E [Timonella sp. A28]|uniref:Na+/H+ antiporter subunit E n=1 Tax=Timonella sp. A28 TaxID=3442640 RepID=UPI003EC02711
MRTRRTLGTAQWLTTLWLTVVWVLLWGDLTWGNLVAGVALALLVAWFMPLPAIDFRGRIRPHFVAYLIARFVFDLVAASFQVAVQAFRFGYQPRGAIVRVNLRSDSDLYLTLTSELSCLVPGSIVVEADQDTDTLYLHILDLDLYGGVEKVRQDVLDLEARVMRAFASQQELERAGVLLHSRKRRGADSSQEGAA